MARLLAAALLLTPTIAVAVPGANVQNIRIAFDGAGPTHLVWIAGPDAAGASRDLLGIVDPLQAALRLYELERPSAMPGEIASRLHFVGACSLPVELRPC